MAYKRKTYKKTSGRHGSVKTTAQKRSRTQRILFTVFVLLLVCAVVFFLIVKNGDTVSVPENAIGSLMAPVENFFTNATNRIKGFFSNWRNYDLLQAEYDTLSIENEQLRMELSGTDEAMLENERLKSLLDAKDSYSSLDPIFAKVISRDAGPWFETFSINRGSSDGIANGMTVVNGDGLIGHVYSVGLNYAKVITIIDSRSAVACLVQRTRDNGIMRGQISVSDSAAECFLYYLPNVNSITPGDTVITSGTDSMYPKGLKVGSVTAVSLDAGSEGTYAVVSPSVDFNHIEEVFVLRTYIETDSDTLPKVDTVLVTPVPTVSGGPAVTATPAPTSDNEIWARPTVHPSGESTYAYDYVQDLIEDAWASAD